MKKKLSVILCLILILSLMTGCTTFNNFKNAFFSNDSAITNVENGERTIKIGVYEPLTGAYKTAGSEEKIGIELAHELYPEVLGRKIELIYGDNQGDMYVAETVIKELVAQKPAVILGSYGDTVTLVAGDFVKEAQIPAITLTSTNNLITVNNPYYFSATFSETKQGYALANFVCQESGKKKVATVRVAGDDTVIATIQRFNNKVKAITKDSGSVVGNYQLDMEAKDFTETLNKIKESGAEAVFLAVSPVKAQEILKQAKELKMDNLLYVGTKALNDETLLKYVTDSKSFDLAYTADFSADANVTKMSETFVTAYKNKYGQNAEPTEAMAVAFDGYLIARAAIEKAYNEIMGTNFEMLADDRSISQEEMESIRTEWLNAQQKGITSGNLIREALTKLNGFEGASGKISFDGSNEANKTIVINHILNGEVQAPIAAEDKEIIAGATDKDKDDKTVASEAAREIKR
ncbi:MAG: ABC transporter substrate-binding protein [Firmicutes bacterium]|nr:ABC transporter substrate-binding protein [Bacillota bacterium]